MNPKIIDRWGSNYGFAWEGVYECLYTQSKNLNEWYAFDLNTHKYIELEKWLYSKELRELFNHYNREELSQPTSEYKACTKKYSYMLLTKQELTIYNFINKILNTHYHLLNFDIEVTHIDCDSFISGVY